MEEQKIVCVIEDNKPIRKLLCTLLSKAGFNTIDFGEGMPAYNWLKENKPDCIIVDILLPDINGTELLKHIRSLPDGNKIPVISVTGFAQEDDRQSYLDIGFDYYISKPVDTSTFADTVKQVINQKV